MLSQRLHGSQTSQRRKWAMKLNEIKRINQHNIIRIIYNNKYVKEMNGERWIHNCCRIIMATVQCYRALLELGSAENTVFFTIHTAQSTMVSSSVYLYTSEMFLNLFVYKWYVPHIICIIMVCAPLYFCTNGMFLTVFFIFRSSLRDDLKPVSMSVRPSTLFVFDLNETWVEGRGQ